MYTYLEGEEQSWDGESKSEWGEYATGNKSKDSERQEVTWFVVIIFRLSKLNRLAKRDKI